ncbi:cytochrome c1 [uncultured Sphingomonas sp.]|uniref:cytochrome c1 n=1 Tax=uncultured Sphingomonas sp. TaxID=158754 RepID=UPI0025CD9A84|nr:cytochrome c1 [uncultured Sphingomonas sp.]
MLSFASRFLARNLNLVVGAGFLFALLLGIFSTVGGMINDTPVHSAEHEFHIKDRRDAGLQSAGLFGTFDKRQLQRGFQVYKEVCSACHSIRLVSFRDLQQLGYDEGQVKTIASDWQIEQPSVNPETGEPATRKNLPSDRFPLVFANDVAARAANNNAVPPDLSLMTKARDDGPDYVYSLLTGYRDQPAELLKKFPDAKTPNGLHYNPYFATLNLAMAPPLTADDQVQYQDGTRATKDQMAKDIAAFLTWTAEPNLESRHAAGAAAVIFLLIFTALAFGAYRNIWRDMKH